MKHQFKKEDFAFEINEMGVIENGGYRDDIHDIDPNNRIKIDYTGVFSELTHQQMKKHNHYCI